MTDALLLSGGIDSIALAFWRRPSVAVTIDYGQVPAQAETQAASAVCRDLAIEHVCVRADCSAVGSGDLVGGPPLAAAPVPEWWPYRNQLLVTIAAAALAPRGVATLALGIVATDRAHADGTPEFVEALSRLMQLQEGGLRVEAPAASLTSEQLVRLSGVPKEILAWAHSCHAANFACGWCRGCVKHVYVMRQLGIGSY